MAKKKYIHLPQGYLSYSQMQLWKANKERYKEIYFNRRDDLRIRNSALDYGKRVADALERQTDLGDPFEDSVLDLIKKYDVRDQEMFVEFKTDAGWLKLIGKPDTFDSKTFEFREYKTGKVKWTQAKAEKHPQMTFYAVIIYLKYGKILADAWLDWVETYADSEGKLTLTGKALSFNVPLGTGKILTCLADIVQTAKEIELEYLSHVRPPEEEF